MQFSFITTALHSALILFLVTLTAHLFFGGSLLSISSTIATENVPPLSFVGTGEVTIPEELLKPEITVTFSAVSKQVPSARETVADKVTRAYRVLHTDIGLPKDAVQSTGFSIAPEYDYLPAVGERDRWGVVGYRVSHTSTVRMSTAEQITSVIDALAEEQPQHLGEVRFTLEEEDEKRLEEEALALAIKDAQRKATVLSRTAKIPLQKVIGISTSPQVTPYPKAFAARAVQSESDSSFSATPFTPGSQELQRTIELFYATD